ncbi:sulfur carrier protein ThiS [Paramaledivibacter caminithermalis]|jgi:sulfur carrier protein|uniref:Sulfur carrier protein n=1 Tax=Paramaledivibacter caminithermalis (strain DSM 15212 / CIP 107654 / DViRD3) TaxID=1121301 RepID=A0A1M6QHQ7_PARC5|nr:sulfur carrier protein ThiS [Paramaledivibacter caminithermalis]SHK19640.1 sulfur carrier protein [Paramaledivibacter caminithermalis DSM 15212]
MLVNGKKMSFENITILQLLNELNLDMNKVVVEVNLEIISKENYCNFVLNKEDRIEIISLVGGG